MRLRVIVDAPLDVPVQRVHVSDLGDPTPYLLGGELVLTNGLWRESTGARAWVKSVASGGAVGVGYGVGTGGLTVPDELVTACRENDLALFEISPDMPFGLIGEWVAERSKAPNSTLRLQLVRTRRMWQELSRGSGYAAVVDLLERETRLPVWLVGPSGESLTDTPAPERRLARAAVRAARQGELPCSLSPQLSAFAVTGATSLIVVLVGAPLSDIDADAQLLIEQASTYLVLEDARRQEVQNLHSKAAAELIASLIDGELGVRGAAERLRVLGFDPSQPIQVVATSNSPIDVRYATEGCGAPAVSAALGEVTYVLVQDHSDQVVDDLVELIADGGQEPVAGVARALTGAGDLRRALVDALSANQMARSAPIGARVIRELSVSGYRHLLSFIDANVLRAFSDDVIGEVERWDTEHATQLLDTLDAFFSHDARWRETAEALHIHQNTLHYRLDKVAQLTGRPFTSIDNRADYLLALAIARMPAITVAKNREPDPPQRARRSG